MKILGQYAELANLQRSVRKDDNQKVKDGDNAVKTSSGRSSGDVVELSEGARKAQEVDRMAGKLKEIPDPREEKIQDVINRLRSGALLNPGTVKSGISRMLDQGMIF